MVELTTEQQLYRETHRLTKLQWEIGPLRGQFGCWRSPGIVEGGEKFDWSVRCKSSACKPGDPYGCSMLKAREYSERTKHLLGEWLGAGHQAYATLFEVTGQPGEDLRAVYRASQKAMRTLLSGKRWVGRKQRFGISGQITSLSFAKSAQGSWIVRRWLILAMGVSLVDAEESELAEFLEDMWARSLLTGGMLSYRVKALHQVTSGGAPGLAQFITGCFSPLDPAPTAGIRELEATFGVPGQGEESTIDLAVRYEGVSVELKGLFDQFEGRTGLIRTEVGGLHMNCQVPVISKSGRRWMRPSVHMIELPERATDFAEYATETFGSTMWTATGDAPEWRRLRIQASELGTPYLPPPEMPELNRPGNRIMRK